MNFFFASASRPMSSCTDARSDQARHQSSHDEIEPVTSSKSLSATPLATKRGAQCEIAELTRGSEAMKRSSDEWWELFGLIMATVPGQEAPRAPGHHELEPKPE